MTIGQAITQCDAIKQNRYTAADKIRWLSDLDGLVKRQVLDTHESSEETASGFTGYDPEDVGVQDTELLIPEPYTDVYLKYLFSQIDFANAEFERYNNSAILYNTAWQAYVNDYNRTHLPLQENRTTVR